MTAFVYTKEEIELSKQIKPLKYVYKSTVDRIIKKHKLDAECFYNLVKELKGEYYLENE